MAASRAAAYKRLLHLSYQLLYLYTLYLSYYVLIYQLHTLYLPYHVQVYDLNLHALYLPFHVQVLYLDLYYLYLGHYYHEHDGKFGQTLVVDHYHHLGLHGGLH